ncbi:MAG TPA: class I SAM-dependent methyltransferase [Thermoanaerobaculia bacterium]|nr:class I SAM-dependent methyltransferase [Thermoanaerobaculia bacterium]
MTAEVAQRVAGRFDSRFLRSYARGKIRSDPVYRAVLERLRGSDAPLFDIGCGVGLLEFYLRENGFRNAITGIDHDERKVAKANAIAAQYSDLRFRVGDARDPMPTGVTVILIDVLHYFSEDDQRAILDHALSAHSVMIRDAVCDDSLRYRVTVAQERFSRAVHWLRADRLNFPKRETIVAPFHDFHQEIVPMWGRTPFNNYLFVFRRSSEGTTKR